MEHAIINALGALILIHVGIAANIISVKGNSKFERIHNTVIVIFILTAAALTGFLLIKVG